MTAGLPGDTPAAEQRRRLVRSGHAASCAGAALAQSLGAPDAARAALREAAFAQLLTAGRIRPSGLASLLRLAGSALGRASALAGGQVAQSVRMGLEDALDDHLAAQAAVLDAPGVRAAIGAGRAIPSPGEAGAVSQAARLACRVAFAVSARV